MCASIFFVSSLCYPTFLTPITYSFFFSPPTHHLASAIYPPTTYHSFLILGALIFYPTTSPTTHRLLPHHLSPLTYHLTLPTTLLRPYLPPTTPPLTTPPLTSHLSPTTYHVPPTTSTTSTSTSTSTRPAAPPIALALGCADRSRFRVHQRHLPVIAPTREDSRSGRLLK